MPSLSPGAQMRAIFLWPALDLAKTALGGHRPDGREGLKVKPTNFGPHIMLRQRFQAFLNHKKP